MGIIVLIGFSKNKIKMIMKRTNNNLVLLRTLQNVLLAISTGFMITGGYGMMGAITLVNFCCAYFGFVGMLIYVFLNVWIECTFAKEVKRAAAKRIAEVKKAKARARKAAAKAKRAKAVVKKSNAK